jgi:hypothetical protein
VSAAASALAAPCLVSRRTVRAPARYHLAPSITHKQPGIRDCCIGSTPAMPIRYISVNRDYNPPVALCERPPPCEAAAPAEQHNKQLHHDPRPA